MAWRNGCEEVASHTKPLFLTIYTVVIIGIVVSFFYVFSAIYSSSNSLASPSSFSSLSHEDLHPTDQTLNISQPAVVHNVPTPSPRPQNVLTSPVGDVPHEQKMPPMEDFRLTKELVQQRVKDNVQWTPNYWRHCIGKGYQFLTWVAI